jgi:hypothetical protein
LLLPVIMETAARDAQSGLEWRVTVPEGASVTVEYEAGPAGRAWAWLVACVLMLGATVSGFAKKVWKIGADDPRKVVHGLKVGVALTLVSVFFYTRPLYDGVGGAAMWAIMTVVVVFEYTVGKSHLVELQNGSVAIACLQHACIYVLLVWSLILLVYGRVGGSVYKGFNRAVATASAGVLALGVNWVASKSGDKLELVITSGSLFLLGAYYYNPSCALINRPRFLPHVLIILCVRVQLRQPPSRGSYRR